jgi:maltokinase
MADIRAAIDDAGARLWLPAHFEGTPPTRVALSDLISLGGGWLAIGTAEDDVLVAPIIDDGGRVRRAVPGDGVVGSLLEVLASDATGSLRSERFTPAVPLGGPERAMGVDQSNESVIVGDRAVVKLFPRTRPGPQPGVDLPAHLSAVGFGEIPTPLGAIRWHDDTLVASVAAFLPGARDGWQWCVDDVVEACEGDDWTAADAQPAAVGGLVGRLHRALSTPSPVIPTPVREAGRDTIATWRADAAARLQEALTVTSGAAGERLRGLEPAARAAIASLEPVERTTVMRIHGDLHVGQVLRSGDGALSVNDFDGNPLASDRMAPDAPARDVASMTCAIDHVGRVVARRHPGHARGASAWAIRSREAFLDAYRTALGDRRELFDEHLLAPFEVVQETHEFVYAARYLPRWQYVPDGAMPAVLERWAGSM